MKTLSLEKLTKDDLIDILQTMNMDEKGFCNQTYEKFRGLEITVNQNRDLTMRTEQSASYNGFNCGELCCGQPHEGCKRFTLRPGNIVKIEEYVPNRINFRPPNFVLKGDGHEFTISAYRLGSEIKGDTLSFVGLK